jgi:two-component system cell cycle sensor histidine kinase/response regulator CckA
MKKDKSPEQLRAQIDVLKEQLENYRVLIDNTPDLLYRTDLEGRITFVSSAVEKLSGYTVKEALGMKMAEEVYLHPEERQHFLELLSKNGRVTNFIAQLKRKDGSTWWASTNAHFYCNHDGQRHGVEGITRDVSELKNAEKALQRSEELFRLAFTTSPDAINLNRASDGVYIDINEGFSQIMGFTRQETIGKSSLALNIWRNPEDRQRLLDDLYQYGYVANMEADFVAKDGRIITGLMSARLIEVEGEKVILSISRDITAPKMLERQLQQAQKFEALGTLAGGIAHDFNNLLMGIQGRASLLDIDLHRNSPLKEHVHAIEEHVQSATALTKQLLGIARRGKYEICTVDLNELIGKTAAMFARTRKELQIVTKFAAVPMTAEVDQYQIEQVVLNILVNAWQAMPDGGKIFLETTALDPTSSFRELHQLEYRKKYNKIAITDTGIGMDEHTRERAFDPFFTTKEVGRGTGLGLASALGIIKNHNGTITIDSAAGSGTTISIFLPSSVKTLTDTAPAHDPMTIGSETILLVDDEPMIIEVGKAMLIALGYKVLVARDGQQAIDIFSRQPDSVDLVILDLIMPGMDGRKTFEAMRSIQNSTPVILSSGYSMDGQVAEILEKGCNGFIQKPFKLTELSQKIRQIMETCRNSAREQNAPSDEQQRPRSTLS